jgi:hypothetical protein
MFQQIQLMDMLRNVRLVDLDMGLLKVVWCRFIVKLLYGFQEYVLVMVDITWVKNISKQLYRS